MRLKTVTFNKKAWLVLGLFALETLCFSVFSGPSMAQSTRELMNRISRLENEIETLNRAVYRGERPPPSAMPDMGGAEQANIEVRLQQFEMELRDLRGKIEEQGHQVRQMKEQLDRALSDMSLRLDEMSGNAPGAGKNPRSSVFNTVPQEPQGMPVPQGGYPPPPPGQPYEQGQNEGFSWSSSQGGTAGSSATTRQLGSYVEGPAGSVNANSDVAATAYENAFSLLKNNQHEEAGRQFRDFVERYPNHPLVSNAQYWLGESYYVRGEYETAARIFAEAYQQFPKASKAPDNLLKLGMSLAAMGNNADACVALEQLESEYGNSSGPVMRRAEQEMANLGC